MENCEPSRAMQWLLSRCRRSHSRLWQIQPTQQIFKARIAAKVIPIPEDSRMAECRFALLIGLFQPLHRLVIISSMGVETRYANCRNMRALVARRHGLCGTLHGTTISTFGIAAIHCLYNFVFMQYGEELFGLCEGFLKHLLLVVGAPKVLNAPKNSWVRLPEPF